MKKLILFALVAVGCKQGLGERCQINDDCTSPYVCNQAKKECQETTTGGLPHVYKHRRATRRQVTLAYGEGDARPQLVITEHPGEPPDGDPIKLDQIGISHLSFTVPSVARLTEDLLAKGYQTAGPPDAFQDASGRVRTVFFFDPDGILVQFDEGGGG